MLTDEEKKIRKAEYRRTHREELRASARGYYKNNKDKKKIYYEKNRDELIQGMREYYYNKKKIKVSHDPKTIYFS